ncbi:barstar family protein [Streptomyces longispororuber]|uniref:barstar family protein n=1 Tax=Streptomyces longispororuber TaxID=68230 RepID=UPI00210DFCBA|nr:barstar family protein [Streptomyces longispororuber]MCQ4206773.1 barstar family protein [Streptomyces longispororuber]
MTGPTPSPTPSPGQALVAAGWAVRVLDLGGAEDKAALMDRCARVLELPDWFGRNWDALADSLGDPGVGPKAAHGLVLVVTGWQEFAERRPGDWETAREVFAEAVERRRGDDAALTVVLGLS